MTQNLHGEHKDRMNFMKTVLHTYDLTFTTGSRTWKFSLSLPITSSKSLESRESKLDFLYSHLLTYAYLFHYCKKTFIFFIVL